MFLTGERWRIKFWLKLEKLSVPENCRSALLFWAKILFPPILSGKKIVLVGAGRLVGRPAALWLIAQDLPFTVLTYQSLDLSVIREADIIISGVGQPRLIRGDMIKDGAILIDAGTSSEAGRLVGDIDAASCQDKSGWLAAAPGGVGPLTVAHLFKNLAILAQ